MPVWERQEIQKVLYREMKGVDYARFYGRMTGIYEAAIGLNFSRDKILEEMGRVIKEQMAESQRLYKYHPKTSTAVGAPNQRPESKAGD